MPEGRGANLSAWGMSWEKKARTHARIVEAAAGMFRENGIAASGVADVMKAAGPTHGGFYRHFASKDDLAAATISHAVSTSLADLEGAEGHEAKRTAPEHFIARYLSDEHVGNPRDGCPLAALGPDAPPSSTRMSNALYEGSIEAVRFLAAVMDGRREAASSRMATPLSTVVMARMAGSHQSRQHILSAGRTAGQSIVKGCGGQDKAGAVTGPSTSSTVSASPEPQSLRHLRATPTCYLLYASNRILIGHADPQRRFSHC